MGPFYRLFPANCAFLRRIPALIIIGLFLSGLFTTTSAANETECSEGFTTTIESVEIQDGCIVYDLLVEATGESKFALSHFVVAIPCGNISDASNSRGWKLEYPVNDPTTGFSGIKVDDIEGFGESGNETFRLTFTVCATDESCLEILTEQSLEVAYKAGTCITSETIPSALQPLSADYEVAHLDCSGDTNGSINVTVNGGVPPYQFEWSNGATTQNLENIPSGVYNLTITDAADSTITLSAQVNSPAPISITASQTNTGCGQSSGAIDLTVTGGTAPYTFQWNNGSVNEDLSDLPGGDYNVIVTDTNGCQQQKTFTIRETSSIEIDVVQTNIPCQESVTGSIETTISGGTEPYSLLWSTGDTIPNLTGLSEGTYFLWVTDAMGCTQSKQISVNREQLSAEIASTNTGCLEDNGSATITNINGTGPYDISWSTGDTTLTAENLPAGNHTVHITDTNGCQITEDVTIGREEGPQINVSAEWTGCTPDDSIKVNLNATDGQAPYAWMVNDQPSASEFYLSEAGDLVVTVTGNNGCTTTEAVTVSPAAPGPEFRLSVIDANCTNPEGAASVVLESATTLPVYWDGIQGSTYKSGLQPGSHEITVIDEEGCETTKTFSISEVIVPTTEILTTTTIVDCESNNNLLTASTTNAETIEWEFESADNSWFFTATSEDTATYTAGTGSAIAFIHATSSSGCLASDYILLECNGTSQPTDSINDGTDNELPNDGSPDDSNGDDGSEDENPDEDNGDDAVDTPCSGGCYEISAEPATSSGQDCLLYSYTITTDGSCRYDLSHLIIELPEGQIATNVFNSLYFPMEINATDPKSGIYGIKVDEITGFGQTNTEIEVSFEVCNASQQLEETRLAFKAGQCLDIVSFKHDNLQSASSDNKGEIYLKVYPNPSPSNVTFSFTVPGPTAVTIDLYDVAGNKVETVFDGEALENIRYEIPVQLNRSPERLFYYRMSAGDEQKSGKILRY